MGHSLRVEDACVSLAVGAFLMQMIHCSIGACGNPGRGAAIPRVQVLSTLSLPIAGRGCSS